MEIFRFIKWQWRHIDADTKRAMCLLLGISLSIVYSVYAGLNFILALLLAAGVAISMVLFMWLKYETLQAWDKYQLEKEREAQKILSRLSGGRY